MENRYPFFGFYLEYNFKQQNNKTTKQQNDKTTKRQNNKPPPTKHGNYYLGKHRFFKP